MNRFSEICLTLAGEVLAICEKEGIPCILSDETAHQLMEGEDPQNLYLLVKADDFDHLFETLRTGAPTGRAVESMKNNDRYPGFSMRYVNARTSCHFQEDVFLHQAIGIYILPLRRNVRKVKGMVLDWLEFWDLGAGRSVYPKLLEQYKLGGEKRGIIKNIKKRNSTYEVSELAGKDVLSLEQGLFPVSNLKNSRTNFVCDLPAALFYNAVEKTEAIGPAQEPAQEGSGLFPSLLKTVFRRVLKKVWQRIYPVTRDWNRIQCANDRDLLRIEYEKKKPLIMELYKNKDVERLREELRVYDGKIYQNLIRCGLTIVFDDDIFAVYKEVYGALRGTGYIKKIEKRIPKIWRS